MPRRSARRVGWDVAAAAQQSQDSRETQITRAKDEKATALQPYEPNRAEVLFDRAEELFLSGRLRWHQFFQSAYAGGGFTLGAGYRRHVSPYNTLDVRGSFTFSGYKRLEAEFLAPRLFNRRGVLSVVGGWREATAVGFYGIGTSNTSVDDRANYSFEQPYLSAALEVRPTRKLLVLGGGLEVQPVEAGWRQRRRAICRGRLHTGEPAGPGHQSHLPALTGDRGA